MNVMDRSTMLQQINEISFAAYDTLLFLDTHPNDQQALQFYREMSQKRNAAMEEFGRIYGPLTVDCTCATNGNRWQWIDQTWPWEGGSC